MAIYPQPKTQRPKTRMDTSGLLLAKEHPVIEPKYRVFVRQHSCALHSSECRGRVVCAHLTQPGHAARSQKYSDAACVPLCDYHHDIIDRRVLVPEEERTGLLVLCLFRAIDIREEWRPKVTA